METISGTTIAAVDRDYLNEKWNREGGEYHNQSKVGTSWSTRELVQFTEWDLSSPLDTNRTRFRLLDDDGEIYYGGWLLDDNGCFVQMLVLEWGTHDSGCTAIQIKKDNEWVQEIA